jgi:SAM-dependent methyltransferase
MNVIPWRIRNAVSDHFPLIYHLAASLFRKRAGQDYWDERLAEGWGKDERRWPTKIEVIAQRTSLQAEILDIACGNGSMMRGLRNCGFKKVSGLEISKYAIARLREEGFPMYEGVLPHLPLSDDSFDTLIASQVLEHIIRRDKFASEMGRVLRPDGQAFFFVPNDCLGPISEPEHVIKYSAATLKAFLGKHFKVVTIEVIKDIRYPMSILLGHVRNRV